MPYTTDGLVGKLALQKGILSASQLKECLAEQAVHLKAGQRRPLGVIMVSRGLMKDEDLLDLLEEQRRVLAERSNYTQVRKEDFLFGQILLKQGLATSEAINQALRTQAEAAERGEMPVPRLGQILIDMGLAEEKAIQETLRLQYKTLYECPGCTLKYNLVEASGAKQYRCKKCGAILVPKPPGTGVKADESAYGLKLEVSEDVPPEVAKAELDPANLFDKYILLNPIGRGGAGTVYRAYQKDLKRAVAIKILRADDPETLERFTREAQTAANLRHPGIVSIYEIGKCHNVPYLAMEFIDGLPLDDMEPGTFKRTCQILRDVAMAVHFAHEKGVIHRDLKPQNILVDSSGRACVTDFGLAREVTPARSITEKGIVVGTPSYMSPEQACGQRDLDGRSDVASLGAVLYELLTGEQPYTGEKALDVAIAVINQAPVRPRRMNPGIPAALEAVCLKAMAKDRNERYASARAFAEDLQRYLEGESVLAEQASVITTAFRRMRKNRTASVVGAASFLALVVMCIVLYALNREARQKNDLLQARAYEEAKEFDKALDIYARHPESAADVARVRGLRENRRRHQELDARRWRAEEILARARRTQHAAARVEIASEAIKTDEEFEEAYVVRATALQELGNDTDAYDDLGRAIEVSTSPFTHLLSRADIARRLGRLEAEIADLTAALEWTPQSADCRVYRAWARVRLAKEVCGSPTPQAKERAGDLIRLADLDLGAVKQHPLLDKVQSAIQEVRASLKGTP